MLVQINVLDSGGVHNGDRFRQVARTGVRIPEL